jgi:nicotinate-nucleotide pyrophosphorylase (carboxylating)
MSVSILDLRPPHPLVVEPLLRLALAEDLGQAGDVTSDAVVPADRQAVADLVVRSAGRVAGLPAVTQLFELVDPAVEVEVLRPDGTDVEAGDSLARVRGAARSLLLGERTALNLLCRLSGIATTTASLVAAIGRTPPHVVCTRKTTPGLRALEKYAVRAGGGSNHRFGLDDAVLIKDNHLVAAGGLLEAVERVRSRVGHLVKIEVEVDSLEQLERLLELGVDAVLLDNMSPDELRRAVERVAGRMITEASGGITPQSAPEIAATGVDLLSVGWLTHSSPALDVGFDFTPA